MKTENMKLLDLQTGKYLELGKDWHYCGNRIYLVGRLKECITSFNEFLRSQMKILDKYKEIDGQGNISYELAFKIATSDDECLNNAVDAQVDSGYVEKSEPQGILKTLCDKTGAVVYGDRYVLSSGKSTQIVERYRFNTTGHRVLREYCLNYIKDTVIYITPESDLIEDVIISTKILKTYELDRNYDANAEIRQGEDKRWYNYLGERNIENVNETVKEIVISSLFEEYSKQLRNEENKFEELMEKLK